MKPELECRLDPRVLAEVAAASPESVNELVDVFMDDAPRRVQALAEALAARDRSGLGTIAHALAGGAAAVGARRLSMMCRALEQAVAVDDDHGAAARLVSRIRAELTAVGDLFADGNLGTRPTRPRVA